MRLYLIRHCESENNAIWRLTGSSDGRFADPSLTELGQAQAQVLAQFLAANQEPSKEPHKGGPLRDGMQITHLYSSLMLRAVQTGAAVAAALRLPLVAWPEIHERGGLYLDDPQTGEARGEEGPGRGFFETSFAELILPETLGEEGWWGRSYEDRDMALVRAKEVLAVLTERHGSTDDKVALVTHGGFTQSLLQTILGVSPYGSEFAGERAVWLKANNGSISCVDIHDNLLRLSYLNYIDFMPGDLLT
jgi:2,3-bisphosphoglycerate-dependent phosphoglycerate mutase